MFDLSWALMRLRSHQNLGWPFFESVNLQGKVGNKLFQIVVLPLEVFNLLTSGVRTGSRVRRSFPASMNSLVQA